MTRVELGYAQLYFEAPVVHILLKNKAELGFFEIRELTRIAQELSGQQPYYSFVDARARVKVTPQGRRVAADPNESPLHRGTALLVNSRLLEHGANFFSNLSPAPYPFKVFTEPGKALEWLGTLYAQNNRQQA